MLRDSECILSSQLRSLPSDMVYQLEYETVLTDPATAASELAQFLSVDPEPFVEAFVAAVRPPSQNDEPPDDLHTFVDEVIRDPSCDVSATLRSLRAIGAGTPGPLQLTGTSAQ